MCLYTSDTNKTKKEENPLTDNQKVAAIKKEIESTHLNTLEDMGEMLDSIIRIVYGIEKTEKLFPKKNALA